MVILDTHVLLWWVSAPERLSARARRSIGDADRLGIPAIVFWEIAVLSRKGRVTVGDSVMEWTSGVLALPRIRCLPMTCTIAAVADSLAMHADPTDRFIVATAIEQDMPLVTRDRDLRKLKIVKTLW